MFKIPEIDFSKAGFLTEETIQYHYGKHHKAYVDNLNRLTETQEPKDLIEIINGSNGALYNNAAQAWNHTFYWLGLVPSPSSVDEKSELSKKIIEQFESVESLREKFIDSASSLFGSGWTWLALDVENNKIEIINTQNATSLDLKRYLPLLICDVWEHAYYIEYRNSRANYLKDFWTAINWQLAETLFKERDLSLISRFMK